MWHQAEDVSFLAADAGDVVSRPVWIRGRGNLSSAIAVTQNNSILALQLTERRVIADVISFSMRYWNLQHRVSGHLVGERCVRCLYPHRDMLTNKMQVAISDQSSGQQPCFAENLKAVADTQNKSAGGGKLFHRVHYGRKAREGA